MLLLRIGLGNVDTFIVTKTLPKALWTIASDHLALVCGIFFVDIDKYDNKANKVQGQIRDVLDVLPEEAKSKRTEPWIGMRSSMVSKPNAPSLEMGKSSSVQFFTLFVRTSNPRFGSVRSVQAVRTRFFGSNLDFGLPEPKFGQVRVRTDYLNRTCPSLTLMRNRVRKQSLCYFTDDRSQFETADSRFKAFSELIGYCPATAEHDAHYSPQREASSVNQREDLRHQAHYAWRHRDLRCLGMSSPGLMYPMLTQQTIFLYSADPNLVEEGRVTNIVYRKRYITYESFGDRPLVGDQRAEEEEMEEDQYVFDNAPVAADSAPSRSRSPTPPPPPPQQQQPPTPPATANRGRPTAATHTIR
ncbi:hypothetical protein C8F01DRAFT_1254928 [Mycena amicta]|nr:hypothetical protein C8F01DRAFT_1254928 [Mycena amicta]